MRKIAIFVEGMTEQMFVKTLLGELAGKNKIAITSTKVYGGQTCPKSVITIESLGDQKTAGFYALLIDCGSDSRVASEIRDSYQGLVKKDFSVIVGLRDVYPNSVSNIPDIEKNFRLYMPTKPFAPELVLATMEIEAWFLAEHTHFEKIDSKLTHQEVVKTLGADPSTCDVEKRACPSGDLDMIYGAAKKAYTKRKSNVQRTLQVLDYARLFFELPARVPRLSQLVRILESFLVPDAPSSVSSSG